MGGKIPRPLVETDKLKDNSEQLVVVKRKLTPPGTQG